MFRGHPNPDKGYGPDMKILPPYPIVIQLEITAYKIPDSLGNRLIHQVLQFEAPWL